MGALCNPAKLYSGWKEITHRVSEIYSILDNGNCCEENKAQKGKRCYLRVARQVILRESQKNVEEGCCVNIYTCVYKYISICKCAHTYKSNYYFYIYSSKILNITSTVIIAKS